VAATQSSTLGLDISIERTAVEASERLVKGRVYLERVDERSPLLNGRMASPTLSKTGPDYL